VLAKSTATKRRWRCSSSTASTMNTGKSTAT
jgi:hypothetical protein